MAKAKIIKNKIDLEVLKENKIKELNQACNDFILTGFTSSATGQPLKYDFDYEAQINISGMITSINAGISPSSTKISWKTDIGIVEHTADQFKQVFLDALMFKQTQVDIYRQKKSDVLSASTDSEINAITLH